MNLLELIDLRFGFVSEKLQNYTISESGCWEYQGQTRKGYGRFSISYKRNRRNLSAHRVSYAFHTGIDPGHRHVCHKCDNPRCINPGHLFLSDHAGNMLDMRTKGRANTGPGEENPNSKITESTVRHVVEMIREGKGNKAIASELPISHSQVSLIRLGRCWKQVLDKMGYDPEKYRLKKVA